MATSRDADLICFSPTRWEPVFQRYSHLMARCARSRRVFFVEPPDFHDRAADLEVTQTDQNVVRVVPKLPHGCSDLDAQLKPMIDALLLSAELRHYELWYGTAAALPWTKHLAPQLVVLDAPDAEAPLELLEWADVVFSNRNSVYQQLRRLRSDVYAFPDSVDAKHFARARLGGPDPADQAGIPRPRLGCCGPIDARVDFALLDEVARLQPDWHIVLPGAVTAWEAVERPRRDNIHWLQPRRYSELPETLAGWDVGILPYKTDARCAQLVNPAKAAELLASGRPVVSTALPDVQHPYGELRLLRIADSTESFVAAVKGALAEDPVVRRYRTDAFLSAMSWDTTWQRMMTAIRDVRARRMARAA